MGEIIDYISRGGDTAGQWAPRMGPLPHVFFFFFLLPPCPPDCMLGNCLLLIRVPLAGLHRPVQLLGCYTVYVGFTYLPYAQSALAGKKRRCEYTAVIPFRTHPCGCCKMSALQEKLCPGPGPARPVRDTWCLARGDILFICSGDNPLVFMFELNMPRRPCRQRLRICNRSAGAGLTHGCERHAKPD